MSAGGDLLKLGIEPVAPRRSASHGEAGYARKERDFYPTEPWVTRALLRNVDLALAPPPGGKGQSLVWEPACGDGRMARVIADFGYPTVSSDIADYGYGQYGVDFLAPDCCEEANLPHDADGCVLAAIVTNPPFDLAVQFIRRALDLTRPSEGKVAILQRHEFDAPQSHHALFGPPFAAKLVLPRRPRWSDSDRASPRFPYAWYLWDWRHQGPPTLRFLPDPDRAPAGEALL